MWEPESFKMAGTEFIYTFKIYWKHVVFWALPESGRYWTAPRASEPPRGLSCEYHWAVREELCRGNAGSHVRRQRGESYQTEKGRGQEPFSEARPSRGQCHVTRSVFRWVVDERENAENGPLRGQVETLFAAAKTWKQLKHPLIGMDKEEVVYIYNGILLSQKKEWNNIICSNMDGLRDYHTKSKNDKCLMISRKCGILKKNDTNELIYNPETDPQT